MLSIFKDLSYNSEFLDSNTLYGSVGVVANGLAYYAMCRGFDPSTEKSYTYSVCLSGLLILIVPVYLFRVNDPRGSLCRFMITPY